MEKNYDFKQTLVEELSVFFKRIVVTREKLQVTTMDEQLQETELN